MVGVLLFLYLKGIENSEDVPPPLPTVPPPDDTEDSLGLQVPSLDLEYTLINAKRNLESVYFIINSTLSYVIIQITVCEI